MAGWAHIDNHDISTKMIKEHSTDKKMIKFTEGCLDKFKTPAS